MLHHTSIRAISFVAAVLFAAGVAAERAPAQDSDGVIVVEIQGDPKKAPPILSDVRHINLTVRAPVGKYLIGVSCFPVEGALRAQLNLPEGQGLLVDLVLPRQPAAKAGVKKYDVILAVDGAKVGDLKNLVAAIDKAKGTAIKLHVLRGGKRQTIAVTPVKRQQSAGIGVVHGKLPEGVYERLLIEGFQRFKGNPKGEYADFHFHAIRPGVFFGQDFAKLPTNLSITITRSGEGPAKIIVKQTDQKWEVTDKELDKLPKDVRGYVEHMMGRSRPYNFVPKDSKWSVKVWDIESGKVLATPSRVQRGQPVEKQLEQMRGELHEIRKALDELLKSRRKPRGKKTKSE
ncbi:MAG: PDZ domain-containing protein [Planctomycetes bacterium]|nr:PDZ domain-containing protein [Planctomycetota bacterium]